MPRLLWGLALAAVLFAPASAQDSVQRIGHVYKCSLADGKVQYTNIAKCDDGSTPIVIGDYPASHYTPAASPAPTAGPESDLTSHELYVNHAGETVHSPSATVSGGVPSGASAVCGDGTYSFSRSRSGTCSHHGGVARWL
jgi:hypothetical protein